MSEYVRCPYHPSLPPLFLAPVFPSLSQSSLQIPFPCLLSHSCAWRWDWPKYQFPPPLLISCIGFLCLSLGIKYQNIWMMNECQNQCFPECMSDFVRQYVRMNLGAHVRWYIIWFVRIDVGTCVSRMPVRLYASIREGEREIDRYIYIIYIFIMIYI